MANPGCKLHFGLGCSAGNKSGVGYRKRSKVQKAIVRK